MNYQDFVRHCMAPATHGSLTRIQARHNEIHAVMGIATESGEIIDAYKKHIFYGQPLDITNVVEEIGDILFYLTAICNELGVTIDGCIETNRHKLEARYPDGFSETRAAERNIEAERDAIEKGRHTRWEGDQC